MLQLRGALNGRESRCGCVDGAAAGGGTIENKEGFPEKLKNCVVSNQMLCPCASPVWLHAPTRRDYDEYKGRV